MGGFRTDGKLIENLRKVEELLYEQGDHELSADVDEAIARLKAAYPELTPE